MSNYPVEVGRVVISKAGRDAGMAFMITAVLDERYVEIADGTLRKRNKSKKKKLKHIETTPLVLADLKEKLEQGKKVFDAELKSALGNALKLQKEE